MFPCAALIPPRGWSFTHAVRLLLRGCLYMFCTHASLACPQGLRFLNIPGALLQSLHSVLFLCFWVPLHSSRHLLHHVLHHHASQNCTPTLPSSPHTTSFQSSLASSTHPVSLELSKTCWPQKRACCTTPCRRGCCALFISTFLGYLRS